MTTDLLAILAFDGISNGAVYMLLGLAFVMIFSVTRVIFIPQGDFVAYGALTLATLRAGTMPATVYLILLAGLISYLYEINVNKGMRLTALVKRFLVAVGIPIGLACIAYISIQNKSPFIVDALIAIGVISHLGLSTYRIVFQPAQKASMLVLLIMSVALHFVLNGIALFSFGAEGVRLDPMIDATFSWEGLTVQGQAIAILFTASILIAMLAVFFTKTLTGKILRAAAVSRLGCRLMGYRSANAGAITFTLAAAIGAVSGILIAPITTIYYDSGFLIGLKGFVGAIIGGLASYPLTAAGSIFVGLLESAGSFWSSPHKEVIVFLLVIPVLLWRSIVAGPHHEEDHE